MTFTSCFAHLRKTGERTISRLGRRVRSFACNLTTRDAANISGTQPLRQIHRNLLRFQPCSRIRFAHPHH